MIRYTHYILILFAVNSVYSQRPETLKRLYQIPEQDSSAYLISNAIDLLHESIVNDDFETANEVISFFEPESDVILRAFQISDYISILYFLGRYDELLNYISYDTQPNEGYTLDRIRTGIIPYPIYDKWQEDEERSILHSKAVYMQDFLVRKVETATLTEEEKAILKLHLEYFLNGAFGNAELEKLSSIFLNSYPSSAFRYFIQSKVIKKYGSNPVNLSLNFAHIDFDISNKISELQIYREGFLMSINAEINRAFNFNTFSYGLGMGLDVFPFHFMSKSEGLYQRIGFQLGVDQNYYNLDLRSTKGTTSLLQFRAGLVLNYSRPQILLK